MFGRSPRPSSAISCSQWSLLATPYHLYSIAFNRKLLFRNYSMFILIFVEVDSVHGDDIKYKSTVVNPSALQSWNCLFWCSLILLFRILSAKWKCLSVSPAAKILLFLSCILSSFLDMDSAFPCLWLLHYWQQASNLRHLKSILRTIQFIFGLSDMNWQWYIMWRIDKFANSAQWI